MQVIRVHFFSLLLTIFCSIDATVVCVILSQTHYMFDDEDTKLYTAMTPYD